MKVKCPTCGIEGFAQIRGRNVMIQHYTGYKDGKRIYCYHKISYELWETMQVNASKNMQVNNSESSPNHKLEMRSPGFEPGITSLEGLCPKPL